MAPRLVVCFWSSPASEARATSERASMLRDLSGRAAVRGSQIVACNAEGVAFSFPVEALPDLMDMLPEPPCTRFGMGLAVGELETVLELGRGAALALGPALTEATALAALAEAGEALVSPALASSEPELLTVGEKSGSHGTQHWRGFQLNLPQPWLPAPAETLSRLDFDAWVGAAPDAVLPLRVGSRSVLVAAEGSGGTRLLRQLVGAERRSLWVAPAVAGEPLGALRRAFSRDTAWFKAGAPGHAGRGAVERLLAGAGLTHQGATELLRFWAMNGGDDGPSIVVVDEADRVDADTLEAVAEAAGGIFAVVARTHALDQLPEALRGVPPCGELELRVQGGRESLELLRAFTAGALHGSLVERWARLGGQSPLGVQEALCCAIEQGELVWANNGLVACRSDPTRSVEQDATYWIRRRLDRFEAVERAVLEAVAVLGGEADSHELTAIADQVLGSGRSLADVTRQLVARRWIHRTGERLLGLVSATHRRVLLGAMSAERRKQWHSLVARRVGSRDRPLSAGIMAVHALLAAEEEQAKASARRAALLLRVNGRETTARAFDALADSMNLEFVGARGLVGTLLVAPPSDVDDPTPEHRPRSASSRRSTTKEAAPDLDLENRSPGSPGDPMAVRRRDGMDGPGRPAGGLSADTVRMPPVAGPAADASSGASSSDGPFACGGTGRRDCRQHLATSLLFARDQRYIEALPHALQALAIARETGDARGEKACVMTLAALSRAAGQPAAAAAWEQRLRP